MEWAIWYTDRMRPEMTEYLKWMEQHFDLLFAFCFFLAISLRCLLRVAAS